MRLMLSISLVLAGAGCGRDGGGPTDPGSSSSEVAAASVVITPDSAALAIGDSVQLTATVRNASGDALAGRAVAWSSPDPALVELSQSGWVRATGAGSARVVARSDDKSDTAVVTIGAPDDATLLSADAVVVDSTKARLVSDSVERASGVFTFRVAPGLPPFEVGQVIVGAQGGGFIRRVTEVHSSDTLTVLNTVAAAFTDAVEEGSFQASIPLSLGASLMRGSRSGTVDPRGAVPKVMLEYALAGVSASSEVISLNGVTLVDRQLCSVSTPDACTNVTVRIPTGVVRFDPTLDVGGRIRLFEPDEFHAVFKGALDVDATSEAEIAGTYTPPPQSVRVATLSATVPCGSLGPLPVMCVVRTELIATIEFDASLEAAVQSGFASTASLLAGITYQGGQLKPVSSGGRSFEAQPITGRASGAINAKLTIHPELHLSLDGVAGPFVALDPYTRVRLTADAATGDVTAEAFYGLDARLGAEIAVMGIDRDAAWKLTLVPEAEYFRGIIHSGSAADVASVAVSPPSGSVNVGETLRFTATAQDDAGNELAGRQIVWSSSDPSVARIDPASGVATGVSVGGPVTVTATSDGKSGTAQLMVGAGASSGLVALFLGPRNSCGRTASSVVFCWGHNVYGSLFPTIGPWSGIAVTPVTVEGGARFAELALGLDHICGLADSGEAYCWGDNRYGQLGDDTDESSDTPVLVSGGHHFIELTAGSEHTCGLTLAGEAYCWGDNQVHQMGNGERSYASYVPTPVGGGHEFVQLAAGGKHTCGVTSESAIYCWGYSLYGALGSGGEGNGETPVRVAGDFSFVQVVAGTEHTCALTTTNATYCWGNNSSWRLGNDTHTIGWSSDTAVLVKGEQKFVTLAAGGKHTCGITADGVAFCWGDNQWGQLGNGTYADPDRAGPLRVSGDLVFAQLAGGLEHTCGRAAYSVVYCWGRNGRGQLGDGSGENHAVPQAIQLP